MTSRFLSNLTVLLLAAALMTMSLALAPAVVQWLGLALGSVIVVVTASAFLARDRGAVQRALDGPVAILAAWMIVACRTFAGSTVRWLTFGEAAALLGFAAVGLIAHEVLAELTIRRRFDGARAGTDVVVLRRRVAQAESEV